MLRLVVKRIRDITHKMLNMLIILHEKTRRASFTRIKEGFNRLIKQMMDLLISISSIE